MVLAQTDVTERLFNLFDDNRDERIYWTEFKNGVQQCMFGSDQDLDQFIFHFFDISEYGSCGVFILVTARTTWRSSLPS